MLIINIFILNYFIFYSFASSILSDSENLQKQSLGNKAGGKLNGERSGGVCLGFADIFIAFVLVCFNFDKFLF